VGSSRKPLGDGEMREKSMDFLFKKFILRAQPKLTSAELFAKINPPHKSSFSKCALSSLKHLQVDLFSIPRVTKINWQPLIL